MNSSNSGRIQDLKQTLDKWANIGNYNGSEAESNLDPYIKEVLKNFSENESKEFEKEIIHWPESHLIMLSDQVLFSGNIFFDRDFLYLKIYGKIQNDLWAIHCLSENLSAILSKHNLEKWQNSISLRNAHGNLVKLVNSKEVESGWGKEFYAYHIKNIENYLT